MKAFEDACNTTESIVSALENQFTRAYMEFSNYNLNRMAAFNLTFQSETPRFHDLQDQVMQLLRGIGTELLPLATVRDRDMLTINVTSAIAKDRPFCGSKADSLLKDIKKNLGENDSNVKLFYQHCQEYLIKLMKQIQTRFADVRDYSVMDFMKPTHAFNLKSESLDALYGQFAWLHDVASLDSTNDEYRQQPLIAGLRPDMEA